MTSRALALAMVLTAALTASAAYAQQPVPAAPAAAKPAKTAAAPKAAKSEGSPAVAGESALRQRVDNLEEQLVDMQVVVGTLESFAKSSGAASASPTYRAGSAEPSGPSSSVDQARVSGLEAQVRSLTAQVQQLTEQVRAQGSAPRRTETSIAPAPTGFGTATVQAAGPDPINGVLAAAAASTAPAVSSEASSSALPTGGGGAPSGDGFNPKQLYETAYGYLLQQDYGAAETAFDDFLKRYPTDTLAGNAQFWLGESFFVRGQFKPAASAFLKGYQTYGRSTKAPDSLLKLAMSLGRLGQKDAACSSFGELNTRFPAASSDVKSRAAAEKVRVGCP